MSEYLELLNEFEISYEEKYLFKFINDGDVQIN